MILPEELKELLRQDDAILNKVLEDNKGNYSGTEPVRDFERVFRKQQKKEAHRVEAADPFEIFGSGVTGYFQIMRILCVVFFVFALL